MTSVLQQTTSNAFACSDVFNKARNIVCTVVYRHPQSNFDDFTGYFYAVVDKISKEFKILILMGDFNLDLLNFEIS